MNEAAAVERVNAAGRAASWLPFGATPSFALMALWMAAKGGDPVGGICSAAHLTPFGGMTAMYVLMSAFHAAPWVRLCLGRGVPG